MNRIKKILVVFLTATGIVCSPLRINAQSIVQEVDSYFSDVRLLKSTTVPSQFLIPENSKLIVKSINRFFRDSSAVVRMRSYELAKAVAITSNDAALRTQVVFNLTTIGLSDVDGGSSLFAINCLNEFRKPDFSAATKDSLIVIFSKRKHIPQLARLLGFLQLKQTANDLRSLSRPGNSQTDRWAALIALSRMGDQNAIQEILRRVRKVGVNDQVVYDVFPDLIYTRQPEVFEYLIEILSSEEKNCKPADAETEGEIVCGYRVMELLAPVVKGFPLKVDDSGDVITKDYKAALETTRNWFKKNKTYKILTDTY